MKIVVFSFCVKEDKMKRGFTLLEIIVVIIILGVLATLGLTQYGRTIERSRGAEAKAILGTVRKFAAAGRMDKGSVTGMALGDVGIGTSVDQAPSVCAPSHYFSYDATFTDPSVTVTATRCAAGGKTPQGGAAAGNTVILITNVQTGVDQWTGNGNY